MIIIIVKFMLVMFIVALILVCLLENCKGENAVLRRLTEDEIKKIAYHEAGHAIVIRMVKNLVKVEKIQINKFAFFSSAKGTTIAKQEVIFQSKNQMRDHIAICLSGYCAEKLVFGQTSNGCEKDLKMATKHAKDIVFKYGMSELGPVSFFDKNDNVDIEMYGDEMTKKAGRIVLDEIRIGEQEANAILTKNRLLLDAVANELIRKRKLTGDEFEKIVKKFNKN